MRTYTDPDLGKCDDCGSDAGKRAKLVREATMPDGERARITVWLCRECSS